MEKQTNNFLKSYLEKIQNNSNLPDFSSLNYDFNNFDINLFRKIPYFEEVFKDFEKNKQEILKSLFGKEEQDNEKLDEKLQKYKKYILKINDKVFPTKSKRISRFFETWKDESLLPDLNRPYCFTEEEFYKKLKESQKIVTCPKDNITQEARWEHFEHSIKLYSPKYTLNNPVEKIRFNALLEFFGLTIEEYNWISLFRLKKHKRYIIEDFEVTPYVWTSICAVFEGKELKIYTFIKKMDEQVDVNDPNETFNRYRRFVKEHHDYVFIGWNSKKYDDNIRECVLKGVNPFFLNELLIGCQRDWKKHLKRTFPESFSKITKKSGNVSLLTDREIKDISINFFKYSNHKPYDNAKFDFHYIYRWYYNWFTKRYSSYIEEIKTWKSYNINRMNNSWEEDFQSALWYKKSFGPNLKIFEIIFGYKNDLWTWDCLESATLKGEDANESKSLKSFIASLGASILEKKSLFHKKLTDDEIVDLTIYNLKDVTFTMYFFITKLLFNLETDWENKFFAYNYYNEFLLDIIEDPKKFGFKEYMTKKTIYSPRGKSESEKELIQEKLLPIRKIVPIQLLKKQNFTTYYKKDYWEFQTWKSVEDIISTKKLQETHATWVSKMLTMNTPLTDKQKEDIKNEPYKYKLPEGLKYLADNYLSPEKRDLFYNKILSKFYFDKEMTLLETFNTLSSDSMGFDTFNILKNRDLIWSFGKGGVHSDIKHLIVKFLIWMADVRGMYPETAAKHGFYPENCNALLYDSIKSRRNDYLKPAGKFLDFLQNPKTEVDEKMKKYLYKTADEVINKWDFLDFNIFKDVFLKVFELHPEYQNNINNVSFEDFVNIIKINQKAMKEFAIFTQIKITIYKLINNTWYGTTGDFLNRYLFDLKVSLNITITGQLSLTLLSLMQDDESIIFNMNTDGIFYHLEDGLTEDEEKDKLRKIEESHRIWEKHTGYVLEYSQVDKLIQNNVNNYFYLVKDKNEELKLKNGKGGFYKDAYDVKNYMTYQNTKISQNTGAAIRIALIREMGLGIPREETFKELIKLKRWDLFQLIVKKGGTFDCLMALHEGKYYPLSENTLRVFPVKNGLDVRKHKIQRGEKEEGDVEVEGILYTKGTKVPGMPPSVMILNDNIAEWNSLPMELDLEFYSDEVQKYKSKYYNNLKNDFEKSSNIHWLTEIINYGQNTLDNFDDVLNQWDFN